MEQLPGNAPLAGGSKEVGGGGLKFIQWQSQMSG